MGRDLASNGSEAGTVNPTTLSRMLGGERGGYNPGTIQELFGDVPQMDTLKGVSGRIARATKDMNPSGTANAYAAMQLLSTPVNAGVSLVTPYIAAKTLTSQKLINALAKPQSNTSKRILGKLAPYLGNLAGESSRGLIERVSED